MDIKDIKLAIVNLNDPEAAREVFNFAREHLLSIRSQAANKTKALLSKGDLVKFKSSKYGMIIEGKVSAINRVNIQVIESSPHFGRKWTVNPSCLID